MTNITSHDIVAIEHSVESQAKKPFTAYALWFFLGWFGAHRFYAGRAQSGFAMAALSLSVIGLPVSIFWWMADAVVLGSILSEERELLYDQQARLLLEERGI
jgi:TM2 domain-containing membrane protein YozV